MTTPLEDILAIIEKYNLANLSHLLQHVYQLKEHVKFY